MCVCRESHVILLEAREVHVQGDIWCDWIDMIMCVCVCALGQWCAVHSVAFGDCVPIPENLVFHDKLEPYILHGHSPDCSLSGKGGHRNKLWVHFIVQGFRPDFGKRVLIGWCHGNRGVHGNLACSCD